MFRIYRKGKLFSTKKFATYDQARQFVRKHLRSYRGRYFLTFTDAKGTNASIGAAGFSVCRS